MLNELISELNIRGANFVKTADISRLSEKENTGYNTAILIGIILSPEFILGFSKETIVVPSEYWEKEDRAQELAEWTADFIVEKGFKDFAEGLKLVKKLIIINGTMGVGKTATSRELNKRLNNSVWLDGDWCWMMNPFTVNDENKNMVINNITYLLRNFLNNSSFEYVIFNWVIHYEDIFNLILQPLSDLKFEVIKISLICSEQTLEKRIANDVQLNLRDGKELSTSLERLELYKNMNTVKIDTTSISITETVDKILEII